MKDIDQIIKICIGMFLCLICVGNPVSLSAIKTKNVNWPLYIPRSIGTILGALFAGLALDRFGRRKLMIISGLWVLLTIDYQPWLPSQILFYLHGLSGFGYGMTFVIYIVYISETVCAKYRGFAVSLSCAARTISESVVISLSYFEYSNYFWVNVVSFVIIVVLALAGLICIWIYNHETHVHRVLQDRDNNFEMESYSNSIVEQEVRQGIEPSEQHVESNSNDKELVENDLLSKSNILMEYPFKVYLKSVFLILIFRLPLLVVQNCAYRFVIHKSFSLAHLNYYHSIMLFALVPLLIYYGYKTGTVFKRKVLCIVITLFNTMFLSLISVFTISLLENEEKVEYLFPLFLATEVLTVVCLTFCSDLLLADFLPLKNRSLNVAIIFGLEHLLKLSIYFIALKIKTLIEMGVFFILSATISGIIGIVMIFKFDSLYAIYQY